MLNSLIQKEKTAKDAKSAKVQSFVISQDLAPARVMDAFSILGKSNSLLFLASLALLAVHLFSLIVLPGTMLEVTVDPRALS